MKKGGLDLPLHYMKNRSDFKSTSGPWWKTVADIPIVVSAIGSNNCCLFTINTIILWSTIIVNYWVPLPPSVKVKGTGWSLWHSHIALHFLVEGTAKSRYSTLGTYLLCQVSTSRWWFHQAWLAIQHCWLAPWCQSHGNIPVLSQDWLREIYFISHSDTLDVVWREGSNCGHIHMYFIALPLPL